MNNNWISREKFKELIGWSCANEPYGWQALKLANGLNGARMSGAKIFDNHYSVYYKYDVRSDKFYFPIIFKMGVRGFVAHNREELEHFIGEIKNCHFSVMDKIIEERVENMIGCPITEIRKHEISNENRIPYDESYDWYKEQFNGYWYVEC